MSIDSSKFDEFSLKKAIEYAKLAAGSRYSEELEVILGAALTNKEKLPKLGFAKEKNPTFKRYVEKWVACYLRGYDKRPSNRSCSKSKTHPDPLPGIIFEILSDDDSKTYIDQIVAGHSVLMRIEMLLGHLLEEYLSEKLKPYGWFCCWGDTISAVDFCDREMNLLQIKNSDNSENSSSRSVRDGTKIIKWSRRKSTKKNHFYWEFLNEQLGVAELSEEGFREFAKAVIELNPACIS